MIRRVVFLFIALLATACGEQSGAQAGTATPAPSRTPTPEIGVTLATRAPPTMVVVQTTPTPLPTATATPSPTPISYVIEEGDTLLGIAIENLTTVEDIEALNPGVIAELLQIGQPLILPPPATPVFSGEAATAIPLRLEVASIQMVRSPVGSLWLLGEVVNQGDFAVGAAGVQIELVGGEGASLMSVPAWAAAGIIRPGERAPFAVLVREPPHGEVQPVVSVSSGESLVEPGSYYLDLAVADSDATIEDSQASVAGMIENVGEETAATVTVVATFYGPEGDAQRRPVSGYAQQTITGPLAPGERIPFAIAGAPPGGPTVDVAVSVYGRSQ